MLVGTRYVRRVSLVLVGERLSGLMWALGIASPALQVASRRCYSCFHGTVSFSWNCFAKRNFSRSPVKTFNSQQFVAIHFNNASEAHRRSIARHYDVIGPWLEAGPGRGAH